MYVTETVFKIRKYISLVCSEATQKQDTWSRKMAINIWTLGKVEKSTNTLPGRCRLGHGL